MNEQPKQLIAELETMNHSGRVRRMVELGQRTQHETAAAELCAELEQGEFYERWMALHTIYGSRDGAYALRALADPSRIIRNMALGLVALACDDTQVTAALAALAPKQQRQLLVLLARRRRTAPIDAFLQTLNTELLVRFLPYGSSEQVARSIEQALESAGASDLHRLATHHPREAASVLLACAAATETLDSRLVWLANAALDSLARRVPDLAVQVVEALQTHVSLQQLTLTELVYRRPAAIADLLLTTGDQPQFNHRALATRLDAARLKALLERGLLTNPEHWFARLSPELRLHAYEVAGLGWRNGEGKLSFDIVRALPTAAREAEARRNLALPALATRPQQRLPYAACLPWDEARAVLEPFIRSPDPEQRAIALPALIGAARYQPEHLADAVQLLVERRNEQDPVRMVALHALGQLPPSRWQAAQLDGLGTIIRAALDAGDCSNATAATAERFVIALLPFHPEWSAHWFATIGRERGWLSSYHFQQRLTAEDVRRIAPMLLHVLNEWQPKERDNAILRAAAMFGKRLEFFPELLDILERMTSDTRSWVAGQALGVIANYRRERLATLIPTLVQSDPSWVTQHLVYTYLHMRRQDLLTPFLGQTSYKGRFSTGKTRFILPLTDGFQRWTASQQATFAAVLDQVTRDEQRDNPALQHVINQLAALPALVPTRVVELAGLSDTRMVAREAALRALGRLDDARLSVPELLAALDDERARIAIYALRRSLLEMPPSQALPLLRAVPLRKVTVAKEVLRLMGELPGDLAYADLLAIAGEELHRDVRVALLRALWEHLDHPETWQLFEAAARNSDAAIASGVIRIPAERRTTEQLRKLAALLALLLEHPTPQVRLDTLNRISTQPLIDPDRVLREPLFRALVSVVPDERTAAACAVFSTYAGREATLIGQVVNGLLTNRRALVVVLETLRNQLSFNRLRLRSTVEAVQTALQSDLLTVAQQLDLLANAWLWQEFATLGRQLAANELLHGEALVAAVAAVHAHGPRAEVAALEQLEADFAGDADPRLRRIALSALVAQSSPPRGWDAERRARLERYQADPAPLVAAAAQFTFPPEDAPVEA